MKSCLLLISGITGRTPYFKSSVANNVELNRIVNYYYGEENVIELDTNSLRDSFTPNLLEDLSLLDITRFYINGLRRTAIRRFIELKVSELKLKGFSKIDLWTHSLGTVEAAGANIFLDDFFMFGSPLGFPTPILRSTVRNELSFLGLTKPNLKCNRLINLWSPRDIVGSEPITSDVRWRFEAHEYKDVRSNTEHSLDEYLEFFVKNMKSLKIFGV
jgi:hypothetical protein